MPLSAKEYGDALMAAHRAGNAEHAAMLARAYQDAKAREAQAAEPATVPQEEGFFDRFGREVKDAMVGNITTAKAMGQGLTLNWGDEAAGWLMSKIHGGDAEEHRKAYMAPIEATPAGRRLAAEVVGGVVGGAPLAGLGIPASIVAATGMGALSGAGANQEDRLKGAIAGGGAGAVAGVAAPAIAGAGAAVANRLGNVLGAANPFVGRGGQAAQKTLRESIENAIEMGAPEPTAAVPLVAQPSASAAAQSVLAGGGKTAARVVGAAKSAAADDEALKAAGRLYQERLGIVPLSTATTPRDISASPTVSSNAISAILGNKDMAPILKKISRDVRFEGIPENNLTLLHQAKAMLAERVRAAKKSGKITETAGRLGSLHKQFEDALEAVAPGYKEVASGYAEEAAATSARKAAAKLAGSDKKFVPNETAMRSFASIVPEFISGSLPGVQLRGALATGAYATQAAAKSARGAHARKLAEILAETDPEKIAAALRMLNKDMTGKPYRWTMAYQGPNALQAWARDEEAR